MSITICRLRLTLELYSHSIRGLAAYIRVGKRDW